MSRWLEYLATRKQFENKWNHDTIIGVYGTLFSYIYSVGTKIIMTILRLNSGFKSAYLQVSIAEQLFSEWLWLPCRLASEAIQLVSSCYCTHLVFFMMFCPDMFERTNYSIFWEMKIVFCSLNSLLSHSPCGLWKYQHDSSWLFKG
jgi:hypothetical protein